MFGYPYYTFLWTENTTTKTWSSEKYKFNRRIQKESGAHVDYLAGLVCLHAGL